MKLNKLILMLSSDQDGEVVAAARAIGRHLKEQKKDWHWLAEKLDGEKEIDPVAELDEKIAYILEFGYMIIRERDFDFVRDVKAQGFWPTAKQLKYLNDLYLRVKRKRGDK